MLRYRLQPNAYLGTSGDVYSNCLYAKYGQSEISGSRKSISDAIRILKNRFVNEPNEKLNRAKNYLKVIAKNDIGAILRAENLSNVMIVCVPRSKATFTDEQRFFHKAMYEMANELHLQNGINAIQRIVNTKTTHLVNTKNGDMSGDGDLPYPGITRKTCRLNSVVRGKTVILVDDIYTKSVNIDEDCCQYLYDNGARKVILYTICKTPGAED